MQLLCAQSPLISFSEREISISQALEAIEEQTPIRVAYLQKDMPLGNRLRLASLRVPLRDLLEQIARLSSLSYELSATQLLFSLRPARNYLLSGQLIESQTQAPVADALIYLPFLSQSTLSSTDGRYRLLLPPGTHILHIQHLSYQPRVDTIRLQTNLQQDYLLQIRRQQLDSVDVYHLSDTLFSSPLSLPSLQLGHTHLRSSPSLGVLPYFLGEVDVLRRLLLVPGVEAQNIGALSIRGGAPDQNRILLDGIQLPNATHMFGLVSSFNPDVIQSTDLYKGSYPPNYGLGASSSVISVRQRNGNKNRWAGGLSLGMATLRSFVEVPIIRGKTSLLLAARTSSPFAQEYLTSLLSTQRSTFSDLNTRFHHQFNDRHSMSLSGYWGGDRNEVNAYLLNQWSNSGGAFEWKALLSPRSTMSIHLNRSHYRYLSEESTSLFTYKSRSFVTFYQSKLHFMYFFDPSLHIETGLYLTRAELSIGETQRVSPESVTKEFSTGPDNIAKNGLENHLFLHLEKDFHRIGLSVGAMLRLNSFISLGPYDLHIYQSEQSFDSEHFIGSLRYKKNEITDAFYKLEPHLFLNYHLLPSTNLKLNYSDTYQHFRQVYNSQLPSPVRLFRITDPYLPPLRTRQLSLGLHHLFSGIGVYASVELYTKLIENFYEYSSGISPLQEKYIERHLRDHNIQANGLELSFQTHLQGLELWAQYTYSSALQRPISNHVSTLGPSVFFSDYDRRHNSSLSAVYSLFDRWALGSNFVFLSGRPYNRPLGQYLFEEQSISYFEGRNQGRLPNYHRLDLSVTLHPSPPQVGYRPKKLQSTWNLTFYNLYFNSQTVNIVYRDDRPIHVPSIDTKAFGLVLTYKLTF